MHIQCGYFSLLPTGNPDTHTYTSLWPNAENCQEDESHLAVTARSNCAFENSPLAQSSLMKMKAVNEAKRQWKPPFWRGQLERRGWERNKYKSKTRYSVIKPYTQCSHDKSAHLFLAFKKEIYTNIQNCPPPSFHPSSLDPML